MRRPRTTLILVVLAAALGCACSGTPRQQAEPQQAEAQQAPQSVEQLWIDFCHYVVIASPELANREADKLVGQKTNKGYVAVRAEKKRAAKKAVSKKTAPK